MKLMAKLIALLVVVVLGVYAGSGRFKYRSAEEVAMACFHVQDCVDQGYKMEYCVPTPINYPEAPEGIYNWGQVDVRLCGDPAKAQPTIIVTCYIEAKNKKKGTKYRESHSVAVPIK
ncbi:MAG: hypothetical protein QNK37_20485 [Acidobacteriota bacterium]|nr:hypothetical protein [Acidobacteriota bacterium]